MDLKNNTCGVFIKNHKMSQLWSKSIFPKTNSLSGKKDKTKKDSKKSLKN